MLKRTMEKLHALVRRRPIVTALLVSGVVLVLPACFTNDKLAAPASPQSSPVVGIPVTLKGGYLPGQYSIDLSKISPAPASTSSRIFLGEVEMAGNDCRVLFDYMAPSCSGKASANSCSMSFQGEACIYRGPVHRNISGVILLPAGCPDKRYVQTSYDFAPVDGCLDLPVTPLKLNVGK